MPAARSVNNAALVTNTASEGSLTIRTSPASQNSSAGESCTAAPEPLSLTSTMSCEAPMQYGSGSGRRLQFASTGYATEHASR